MKKYLKILIAIVAIGAILLPVVALAVTPTSIHYPDVALDQITSVDAYNHYIELNDLLVVVGYYMKYTPAILPSLTIDQTYVGRFLNAGGVELANSAPYAYFNSGYDHGYFSMYWPAATAPALPGAYTSRLDGNPLLNWLGATSITAMSSYQSVTGGGVFTDQTAAANSAAANDFNPLSNSVALGSGSYMGSTQPFDRYTINLGTSGSWTGTDIWEYYNDGGVWAPLAGVVDGTTRFTTAVGNHDVTWTMPTNWATTTVNGVGPYYYVRVRVDTFTATVTTPLGTQSWVDGNTTPPTASNSAVNLHVTATVAATSAVLGMNILTWATSLSNYWNVALTQSTSIGPKLSTYGDAYFTNVIPQLRTQVPSIYVSSTSIVQPIEPTSYNTPVPATLNNSWPWAGTVGSAGPLMKGFFFWLVVAFTIYFVGIRIGRIDIGVFAVLIEVPIAARMGVLPLGQAIVFGMLCLLALGFTMIIQRGAT